MKSLEDIKKLFTEKKSYLLLGGALAITLLVYFISWHVTIVIFGSIYSLQDVSEKFLVRTNYYLLESFLFATVAAIVLMAVSRPLIKNICIGVFLALFAVSEIIRMVDWGALYFMGNHI